MLQTARLFCAALRLRTPRDLRGLRERPDCDSVSELAHASRPCRHARLSCVERCGMGEVAGRSLPRLPRRRWPPARQHRTFLQIAGVRRHRICLCAAGMAPRIRQRVGSGHGRAGRLARRPRLEAICHVDHRASAHVLEKCGFQARRVLRHTPSSPTLRQDEVRRFQLCADFLRPSGASRLHVKKTLQDSW